MTTIQEKEGSFEGAIAALSRALAQRLTRRSALTRLGRYGVALSLGAAGASLLDDAAWAAGATSTSCCGGGCIKKCCGSTTCNDSIWCYDNGYCPSGTCPCGSWISGTCTVNGKSGTQWNGDCCGGCSPVSTTCNCVGCNVTCCNYHTYNNGDCAACTSCSGDSAYHIACRRQYCIPN